MNKSPTSQFFFIGRFRRRRHNNNNLIINRNVTILLPRYRDIPLVGRWVTASDRHRRRRSTTHVQKQECMTKDKEKWINTSFRFCVPILYSTVRLLRNFVLEARQTTPQTKDSVDNGFVIANPFHPKMLYTNYITCCQDNLSDATFVVVRVCPSWCYPAINSHSNTLWFTSLSRILVKTLSSFPRV